MARTFVTNPRRHVEASAFAPLRLPLGIGVAVVLLAGCGAGHTTPKSTVTVTTTRASATTSAAPTTSAPAGETLRAGQGVDAAQIERLRAGESYVDSVEICLRPENLDTGEGCAKSMTLTREDVLNKSDDEVAEMILGAMFETILEDEEFANYLDDDTYGEDYPDLSDIEDAGTGTDKDTDSYTDTDTYGDTYSGDADSDYATPDEVSGTSADEEPATGAGGY